MIRIAGGTPEHIEEYAAVVSQEVMQMSADLRFLFWRNLSSR